MLSLHLHQKSAPKEKLMIILGLDPGLATTGFGVISAASKSSTIEVKKFGVIITNKKLDLPARLLELQMKLRKLLNQFNPDAIAIEKLFFNTNQKTVIEVAEARGVLILTVKLHHFNLFEYTPLQVKCAVAGYGRAEKTQVQKMAQKILKLKLLPRPDDAADALSLCLCHLYSQKSCAIH